MIKNFEKTKGKQSYLSLFIRDYLLGVKEAYPYQIYQEYKKIRKITPQTFYTYIWVLEKLGLIIRTGKTEPSSKGKFDRVYYKINPYKVDDEAWVNPKAKI